VKYLINTVIILVTDIIANGENYYIKGDVIMSACIYCIENIVNNHCYIGQTVNFKTRLQKHFYELERGEHCNAHLQRAYKKYGKENFKSYIIEEVEDYSTIGERESYWIKIKGYYNIDKGRAGFTPKALQNMSEGHIGKTNGHRLIKDDEEVLEICAILEFCDCCVRPLVRLTGYSRQVLKDLDKSICYRDLKQQYESFNLSEKLQYLKKGLKHFNYSYWDTKPNNFCPLKNRYIYFLINNTKLTYEKIGELVKMSKGGVRKLNTEVKKQIREINTTYSNIEILQILQILLDNNTVLSTINISESVETISKPDFITG